MDLISDLGNDLAVAFLVEKVISRRSNRKKFQP